MADRRTLKRLLDYMRAEDIAGALEKASWATSGSKTVRIERIIEAVFEGDIRFDEVVVTRCAGSARVS